MAAVEIEAWRRRDGQVPKATARSWAVVLLEADASRMFCFNLRIRIPTPVMGPYGWFGKRIASDRWAAGLDCDPVRWAIKVRLDVRTPEGEGEW